MAFDLSSLSSIFKLDSSSASRGGVIGIDIGASAIKIIQLKNERGLPTLETYGELQLGPYEGGDIGRTTNLPPTKIVEALVDILREAAASGTRATFALSYSSSFINVISVPALDEGQISAMLPVEARKYVPLSLSRVTLDWTALSVNEEKRETEILLSAVYNEAFARYESIMQGAGLEIISNEIELFSSIRSVVTPADTAVAMLDIGASSTRLYIIENGFVRKTHSVLMSGSEMSSALATGFSIPFADAEEMKRTYGMLGGDPEGRARKILIESIERGLRELHIVVSRYEQEHGVQMQKIILSGGGSLLSGLDAYVQTIFTCPVAYADPFSKVAYPAFLEDTLKKAGASFAVAVGVALRGFQFEK